MPCYAACDAILSVSAFYPCPPPPPNIQHVRGEDAKSALDKEIAKVTELVSLSQHQGLTSCSKILSAETSLSS